jgi:hypothetical protein
LVREVIRDHNNRVLLGTGNLMITHQEANVIP